MGEINIKLFTLSLQCCLKLNSGISICVCCWWPRRGSCRTPRSNETVSGFRLYCKCSCAWHSNILTEHETGNVTLVREQGKRSATYGSYSWRLDTYGSYSWRSTEFYDQPPNTFPLSNMLLLIITTPYVKLISIYKDAF